MIDTHVHVWDSSLAAMPWLASRPLLRAKYSLQDLAAEAGPSMPERLVVVQGGTGLAGLGAILQEVKQSKRADAVVASLIPGRKEHVPCLRSLLDAALDTDGSEFIRGVRVPGRGKGHDYFSSDECKSIVDIIVEAGLIPHLLVDCQQLPGVAAGLRLGYGPVVVDHLGSPPDQDSLAGWIDDLAAVAAINSTYLKVSGESIIRSALRWSRSVLDGALSAADGHQLMFGSDWPMTHPVLPYCDVVERMAARLSEVGASQDHPVWEATARHVYDF